ncbi:MAG: DNA-directed RNA polymerase subunit beta, partial [Planctomycetes bacterium]|nr:DNA-directed RNA polymerase subunit beta [Planctomycetota bacterium]
MLQIPDTPVKNLPRRHFGVAETDHPMPNLVQLQTESYARFLQAEVPQSRREMIGLNALFHEVSPILSYDGTQSREFVSYEFSEPRYDVEECKALRLTYGAPLKVTMRLHTDENNVVTEEVYLGEMPLMIGGGEFIINGAERVVVNQLHRSPGIDFDHEMGPNNKPMHRCFIVPERGSWIELAVTKKDTLQIRIDQSARFSAITFLRAMSPNCSSNTDIIKLFYPISKVKVTTAAAVKKIVNKYAVEDIVDPDTGELFAESGHQISPEKAEAIKNSNVNEITIIKEVDDPLVINSLRDEDPTRTQKAALELIYKKMRPGNP